MPSDVGDFRSWMRLALPSLPSSWLALGMYVARGAYRLSFERVVVVPAAPVALPPVLVDAIPAMPDRRQSEDVAADEGMGLGEREEELILSWLEQK